MYHFMNVSLKGKSLQPCKQLCEELNATTCNVHHLSLVYQHASAAEVDGSGISLAVI